MLFLFKYSARMSVQYQIFEAAKTNNLHRVEELLDSGVDPNLKDFDSESTPLHLACANGGRYFFLLQFESPKARQTMELLVKRGANVNAANKRGLTPLHNLISKRYDALALWLISRVDKTGQCEN